MGIRRRVLNLLPLSVRHELLPRMWKQVRKRAGYMTGITQNVGEMLTSKDALLDAGKLRVSYYAFAVCI